MSMLGAVRVLVWTKAEFVTDSAQKLTFFTKLDNILCVSNKKIDTISVDKKILEDGGV